MANTPLEYWEQTEMKEKKEYKPLVYSKIFNFHIYSWWNEKEISELLAFRNIRKGYKWSVPSIVQSINEFLNLYSKSCIEWDNLELYTSFPKKLI